MPPAPQFGFQGPRFTALTKLLLTLLIVLYVLQLVASSWLGVNVLGLLAWWPRASGSLQPWQPLTSWLLGSPDVLGAIITWVVLAFILPSVQNILGGRGMLQAMGFTLLVATVFTGLLDMSGLLVGAGPAYGLAPLILAMISIFGFLRPDAQILIFFILPIRAGWLAWGGGLFALLMMLARRDLPGSMYLGGWLAAWLWTQTNVRQYLNRPKPKAKPQPRGDVLPFGRRDDQNLIH